MALIDLRAERERRRLSPAKPTTRDYIALYYLCAVAVFAMNISFLKWLWRQR